MRGLISSTLLLITVFFFSCNEGDQPPDVNHIEVNLHSRRLDKDLLHVDTNNLVEGLKLVRLKYPDFLDFYLDTLLGFGVKGNYVDTNTALSEGVRGFLTHKDYRGLLDTINRHFPDVKKVDAQIAKSFQYLNYYFPNWPVPKIIYFSSGLNNWGALTVDDVLGIGLDMFLGKQYPFYRSVGLAPYLYEKYIPAFIPVAAMSTQYDLMAPFELENKSLLNMIIQKGRQQYFLEKTVPYLSPAARMGYTDEQWDWCVAHEKEVYSFFIQGKLLYETNMQKVIRYVMDGPTSTGMPAESPGNIGTWLGYRIVKSYMKNNEQVSLKELMQPFNAEEFLRKSNYKP